jgi:hypothetical protein
MHVPLNISVSVETAWGDILHTNLPNAPHGEGDYLVCRTGADGEPDLSDVWVLNGVVFPEYYDTHSGSASAYAEKLFDNSHVHRIDVQLSDADWSGLLDDSISKTKYAAEGDYYYECNRINQYGSRKTHGNHRPCGGGCIICWATPVGSDSGSC